MAIPVRFYHEPAGFIHYEDIGIFEEDVIGNVNLDRHLGNIVKNTG
jgi:hypothetical protein